MTKKQKYKILPYRQLYTKAVKADLAKEGIRVPSKTRFTCNKCRDNKTCEMSWDLYNTDGDCLAMK